MPVPTRRILDALPDRIGYADVHDRIDLSTNEPRLRPPQPVIDAIQEVAAVAHRYPQPTPARVTSRLALHHGIDPLRFVVGNGSANVLQQLILAVCDPGTSVVYGVPGFQEYHDQPRIAGARGISVPLARGQQDLDSMAAAIDRDTTRMVFLSNPHNPTGSLLSTDQLERLLDRVPENVLVVVDEAYIDYTPFPATATAITIGRQDGWENLAVVRSMSKGHGIAGARLGYAITSERIASAARKCSRPYSVNSFAEAAAVTALALPDEYEQQWQTVRAERQRVRDQLQEHGYATPESHGNFTWLPLGGITHRFHDHCMNHKIVTRACPGHGVRVTVGTPEENDAFIAAARTFPLDAFASLMPEGTP